MSHFHYRLYGLQIQSDRELTELTPVAPTCPAEVVIQHGVVPVALPNVTDSSPLWQTDGRQFLVTIPNIAYYHIVDHVITVAAFPNVPASDVHLYLLGTALGIVLHQHGSLPLHASAIEVRGRAVAFAGVSGEGKSTLAAHLHRRGYRVFSDDMAVMTFDDPRPVVQPGFQKVKLWQDALSHLPHDATELVRDHSRMNKYHLALPDAALIEPAPLAEIYVLTENRLDHAVTFTPMETIPAIFALGENAYRPAILKSLGKKQAHFQQCSQVMKHAKMFVLSRPKVISQMDALIDALEARWQAWA